MTSLHYQELEVSRTWLNTAGDENLDLGGLAASAVAMGAYWDRGAAPYSPWTEWELFIDGFDTAPVVGEAIYLYVAQAHATTSWDGEPTTDPTDTVEGTFTVNQLANLGLWVAKAVVVSTTAGDNLRARGIHRSTARYLAPVVYNKTADALLSTADAHSVIARPIPMESQ